MRAQGRETQELELTKTWNQGDVGRGQQVGVKDPLLEGLGS